MISRDQVIKKIGSLEDIFWQSRAVFPTLGKGLIGKNAFPTARFYLSKGYEVFIQTGKPITQEFIDRYSEIGKWINENAIIRLHGIMEYHGLLEYIDQSNEGWKEVDLMRRMRNVFTKTELNYEPSDPDNIRLREEIIKHFKLKKEDIIEEIPTPIDKVIRPIFNGCRNYVSTKLDQ